MSLVSRSVCRPRLGSPTRPAVRSDSAFCHARLAARWLVKVPADRSLLEMLESHGVPCLADCLRGECGLCAVEVLEVQGRIDHRDVFFSAAEKSGNQRLCACVSRACGGGLVIDSAWRPDTLPSLETP